MADYTPHTWSDGDEFTAAQATALSQQLDEEENTNTAQATAIAALKARTFHVDDYGADATGVAASDTAVAAAITAIGTNPGILEFGVGTYKLNSTKTLAHPGQGIKGQGVGVTTIDYRGTGDCLRVWDSGAPTDGADSPGPSAPITGFRIYGYDNANTNTCGLHIGDLLFITITDVRIDGFNETGGKGFWGENLYTWSERAWIQMDVEHCTQGYVFDRGPSHALGTTSWSYSWFFLSVIVDTNQTAFTITDNTLMEGTDFRLFGNAYPGTANTGVVLQLGTSSGDQSYIAGHVIVDVECINGSGSVGHKDINTPNTSIHPLVASGVLRFKEVVAPFVAGTATPTTVHVAGFIDSPSLGTASTHGNAQFRVPGVVDFVPSANGVNGFQLTGRATGSPPIIGATGADSNISLGFAQKGTGAFYYYQDSGGACVAQAAGNATNVGWNFTTQGTGTVQANGSDLLTAAAVHTATSKTPPVDADEVPLVDSAASFGLKRLTWANLKAAIKSYYDTVAATMTNKTLTGPIVDQIKHVTNSNVLLAFNSSGTRTDYLEVTNFGTPALSAGGSSTNVSMQFNPKGNGVIQSYVNTQAAMNWQATGDLTDVSINFMPQGAGRLQEGGNKVGSWISVPSTATSTGLAGQMAADSSFLYICTATNTWRRVAIATW